MRFRVDPSVKRYTSQSSDFQLWTNQGTVMSIPGRPKIAGDKYPGLIMATSCRLCRGALPWPALLATTGQPITALVSMMIYYCCSFDSCDMDEGNFLKPANDPHRLVCEQRESSASPTYERSLLRVLPFCNSLSSFFPHEVCVCPLR